MQGGGDGGEGDAGTGGGGGGGGGGNNDLYLVSHEDFCVYGPREAGKAIATVGQDVVSWCTTGVSLVWTRAAPGCPRHTTPNPHDSRTTS